MLSVSIHPPKAFHPWNSSGMAHPWAHILRKHSSQGILRVWPILGHTPSESCEARKKTPDPGNSRSGRLPWHHWNHRCDPPQALPVPLVMKVVENMQDFKEVVFISRMANGKLPNASLNDLAFLIAVSHESPLLPISLSLYEISLIIRKGFPERSRSCSHTGSQRPW